VERHYQLHSNKNDQLVISVKEARKILGIDAHTLSDNQVKELVLVLTSMAEDFLQTNGSKVK
jgi:hypothetical protein